MSKTGCVILNYNDYETTTKLINTIKDFSALDHIVIVDNNSTNNSYEMLKEYENNKIVVLQSGKNGGYGFGNNVGIKYCNEILGCDYCLISNPDVVFSNKFVRVLISFMDKNDKCGLVSGIQKGPNASAWKETSVVGDVIFNNMLLNKIFKPRYYPKEYFNRSVCKVYAVPGCLFLARIDALYDIGLYDEDFFLFEEEKILAKKLMNNGWKSYIVAKISYIHTHSVSINKSLRKLGEAKRVLLVSNRKYLKKYCGVRPCLLIFIRAFHEICILESILYSLYKRIKK